MGSGPEASRMGRAPQHEQADPPALADREGVLADLVREISDAWTSFDEPRSGDPALDQALAERLATVENANRYDEVTLTVRPQARGLEIAATATFPRHE
jgi:hypothetical protein